MLDDSDDGTGDGTGSGSRGTSSAGGSTPPTSRRGSKQGRASGSKSSQESGPPHSGKAKREYERIMAARQVKGKNEYLMKFKGVTRHQALSTYSADVLPLSFASTAGCGLDR